MSVSMSTASWVTDYLSDRPQFVLLWTSMSDVVVWITGGLPYLHFCSLCTLLQMAWFWVVGISSRNPLLLIVNKTKELVILGELGLLPDIWVSIWKTYWFGVPAPMLCARRGCSDSIYRGSSNPSMCTAKCRQSSISMWFRVLSTFLSSTGGSSVSVIYGNRLNFVTIPVELSFGGHVFLSGILTWWRKAFFFARKSVVYRLPLLLREPKTNDLQSQDFSLTCKNQGRFYIYICLIVALKISELSEIWFKETRTHLGWQMPSLDVIFQISNFSVIPVRNQVNDNIQIEIFSIFAMMFQAHYRSMLITQNFSRL